MTFDEAYACGDCYDCEHDPVLCQMRGYCKAEQEQEDRERKYKEMLEFNGRRTENNI